MSSQYGREKGGGGPGTGSRGRAQTARAPPCSPRRAQPAAFDHGQTPCVARGRAFGRQVETQRLPPLAGRRGGRGLALSEIRHCMRVVGIPTPSCSHGATNLLGGRRDETCPVSTGGGTRRVQSVREGERGGGLGPARPAAWTRRVGSRRWLRPRPTTRGTRRRASPSPAATHAPSETPLSPHGVLHLRFEYSLSTLWLKEYRPPPSRTRWTRLVPPPVLGGHVSSLLPY